MRYLIILFMTSYFAITSSYAQDADEQNRQLSEITDQFLTIQKELAAQDQEATRILGIGLPDQALRADLKAIVENVIGLQKQLKDIGQELKILTDNMNINPLKPFEIIIHKTAKDAPPLTTPIQAGEILYFTVDMAATKDEDIETRLVWSIMTPNGKLSENLKKTENILLKNTAGIHSFGINTTGLDDGHYTVMLEHNVVGKPDHKFMADAGFDMGMLNELKIIKLVVDDEKAGDKHQSVLALNATPFLFSYYQTPSDITALTASYRVWDITARKEIYKKTGRRQNKPDIDTQRVGIRLDPEKNPLVEGHEYRFSISFIDNLRSNSSGKKYKKVKDSITFFYGNEPRYVKINRLVAGPDKDTKTFSRNIPLLTSLLYLNTWVKAAKSIDEIAVDIRLIRTKDKSVIFETTVTKENDKEQGLNHLTFPVAVDLLTIGARYRQEVTARVEGLDPVTSRRSFTYAPKPPVDMSKYIKVSGVIKTPGLPDVIINSTSDVRYTYRQNSTIIFTVPAVYPDGVEGDLRWRCKYCGGVRETAIPLDGSTNDWGLSYSPGTKKWGRRIELFHGRKNLFSASFRLEKPFYANIFTDYGSRNNCYSKTANKSQCQANKKKKDFYPWGMDDVGILLRANSHASNVTVTVKATLKNTGEIIFNETKSISLPADKEVKLLWKIDPDKLKFDFVSIFPKIKNAHTEKRISLEVTVDDGKGYKISPSRTFSRKIFIMREDKYFKDGPGTPENPLVGTILPPAGMKGPFKTTITGVSTYYMDGLKWYYDPEKLASWVAEVGATKYKETKDRRYYRKTVPLLITITDSTGKKAVAFWKNYTYSVNIWKEQEEDE